MGQRPLLLFVKGDKVDNNSPLNRAKEMLEPIVTANGVELYDIAFLTEHGRSILRLYIETENGVTLDDCERISRIAEAALDKDDPIPGSYILEVSSPGIERKLIKHEHYQLNLGKQVKIKLKKAVNEQRFFHGELVNLKDSTVLINENQKGEDMSIDLADIEYCRIVYDSWE